MQDYNTIIGSIQMRLNGCQTRSVMDRYKIGSGTLNLIMSRYHANGIHLRKLRTFSIRRKIYRGKMSHFQISSITMTESMHQGAA